MINKKTFTKVLPTIPASLQLTARFDDADILFDWHKVEDFRGASIDGVQVIARTPGNPIGMDLLFASSHIKEVERGVSVDQAPPSLGTVNSAVSLAQWKNNLTGIAQIVTGDFNDNDLGVLHIAEKHGLNIPVSGDLYIAAITKSTPDYRNTAQVSTQTATNTTAVVVKTISALTLFAPGDVINDQDDQHIGTVRSVTDANNIVLTKNCASVSAVDKLLYNIHPVQIMLSGSL
tara:strand:- start:796 stop:1494 length:699 start_codon:yes stop_codon:yes gene_type:complete